MTKLKYLYNVNYIKKVEIKTETITTTIQTYLYDDDNAEFVIAGY